MDWLRLLLTVLSSPSRGMAMVRDRSPLGQAVILALITQSAYLLFTRLLLTGGFSKGVAPFLIINSFFDSGRSLVFTLLAFVPPVLIVGNLLERRSDAFRAVGQEYAPLASVILFALAAAYIVALPLAVILHVTGLDAVYIAKSIEGAKIWSPMLTPDLQAQLMDPRVHVDSLFRSLLFPFYAFWIVVGIKEVYRFSWLRAIAVTVLGSITMLPIALFLAIVIAMLGPLLSSPLILLLLYFYLRGYFGDVARTQKARASFRRNLEASTLNPADASAHYNLGLLHLHKKELEEARARFQRAVEIDPEEVDAHYQLGRIARMQNRLQDAIANFSEVIARDEQHAQYEVWREIGATYIAAGQFGDASDALQRFTERRESDPQGLYLLGRAQAGLGRLREAAISMKACIEAVKSAPAYKYRTEKRWLNEAQQFLRTQE
jgi:tetratricopeptide (TPR) repeat protein